MNLFLKIIVGIIVGLLAVLGLGWLGLQIRPRPFDPVAEDSADLGTVPLPTDLPAPVYRHFQIVFGDEVPVVKTAVIPRSPPCPHQWPMVACTLHFLFQYWL